MPKERKKRGRREEKKRKREVEEDPESHKRLRLNEADDQETVWGEQPAIDDHNGFGSGAGEMPFYGLLDEEEQEYFKRADTMLELNQFGDVEERALFLANVYKEASGKELKIANSQSCSRLMERLILLSTPEQLKTLLNKFSGQFASHCCEALFLQTAPLVTQELTRPDDSAMQADTVEKTTERLILGVAKEFDGNLGYLMTDQFASHTLRVLLLVLSGRPLGDLHATSLRQSKRKENISCPFREVPQSNVMSMARTIPDSFGTASEHMMKGIVAGLDTTYLRALAAHPVANPLLQLVLDLEFRQSGKSKAKDPDSLFRKLLPDDPPEQGTDSASFFNGMLYDPIGSRLLEVVITHAPGKTFKTLFRSLLAGRLPDLAKNEMASYVLVKAFERLNKEDLTEAVQQLCPQIQMLLERSRLSVVRCLVERCQVRDVNTLPLYEALDPRSGKEPISTFKKLIRLDSVAGEGMSDDRRKQVETQDPSKAHAALLAQSVLEVKGPLQGLVTLPLSSMSTPDLLQMAKDRNATHILQKYLTCSNVLVKDRRKTMQQLNHIAMDLATDPVASHVLDAYWTGSSPDIDGVPLFVREALAERLLANEAILRASAPGRAVWRTWKMDIYKTRRYDWKAEGKKQNPTLKTSIELARERYATGQQRGKGGRKTGKMTPFRTGANAKAIVSAT
ncbi:MAG: hypothetical protein Q9174_000197 [Haloplaca sp. 1 TL-2023]